RRYGQGFLHGRASRPISACVASAKQIRLIPVPTAKPRPIVSQRQCWITSDRTASIRYETGFAVATHRNQVVAIRLRGMFIDERKRKTKNTGKRPWTASVDPVRNAAQLPNDANARAIIASSTSSSSAPAIAV